MLPWRARLDLPTPAPMRWATIRRTKHHARCQDRHLVQGEASLLRPHMHFRGIIPGMSTETSQEVTIDSMSNVSSATSIALTDVAATKVAALLQQEGRDDLSLRVAVQPGGCSGLRYQLYFDDRTLDGDTVTAFGSVKVVTDKMSTPYLMGASIDFVDTIEKQGFTIDNPNAQGSCACGDSFN